jgi:preprotein translocase subunit SecE|tara:strand:+ start:110 stop:313 length:204 start_codon:yes stop_codon:yes gene_type:complete
VLKEIMTSIVNYIKDSFQEVVEKVSWPTFGELLKSTNYVVLASVLFALVIFAIDQGVESIVNLFYGL